MGIEALGGTMSYQAQTTMKPQVNISQPTTTTEGQVVETNPLVDANTAAIEQVNQQQNEYQENQQNQQPSQEQLRKAVEDINKKANYSDVQFGIHEETNRVTIKIVDRETKKVIKELPPEKTLDMIAKAWELAGILVDEKR